MSFSLLFDTDQDAAQLLAECRAFGAMTTLPLEPAWALRVVQCSECAMPMRITCEPLERLKEQTESTSELVDRVAKGIV